MIQQISASYCKTYGILKKKNRILVMHTPDKIDNFFINSIQHTEPKAGTILFYHETKIYNTSSFDFRMITEEEIDMAISLIKTGVLEPDGISLRMILHCCLYIILYNSSYTAFNLYRNKLFLYVMEKFLLVHFHF